MEFGVEEETCEKERVVKTTNVLEYTHDCVYISGVHVDLFVHLKHLEKVETSAWPCIGISYKICLGTKLVEIVIRILIEES